MAGQKGFLLVLGGIAVVGAGLIYMKVAGGVPSIPANTQVLESDTSGFRGYVLGSPDAPVEITEYADFQCPSCGGWESVQFPDVKARLIDAGKARFRYRDLPLDFPYSRLAAHAAACADDQGRFWETKSAIYRSQQAWGGPGVPSGRAYDILTEAARTGGNDVAAWKECMESTRHAGRIQASLMEARSVGASSTPTLLIGGRLYPGIPSDQVVRIVDSLITAGSAATP